MGILNAVFIYFLVWWVLLFTVLPLGVERHEETGRGYDAGAPKNSNLKKKIILNSVMSAAVVLIMELLVRFDVIRWHEWFEGAWS